MTHNDLSQIRAVFKEEIRDEVKKVVEDVLEQKLEEKLEPIKTQLKSMDTKITKLQRGQNIILKYVDEQDTRLEKRVSSIEDHLHFPGSRLQ